MMQLEKTCLDCGEPIKGRADKKFCDDQCRNNYNNQLKSSDESYIRQVNGILKKNRHVLEKLNPGGKTKVTKDKLLQQGLNLNYFTGQLITKAGKTYYFCYDYGYLPLENDEYLLVKKEDS